jgi:hypothetical protein
VSKKAAKDAAVEAAPADDGTPRLVSLQEHPGAQERIRRVKALGGLVAFLLVTWGSTSKGAPLPDALFRGLVAGVIGLHVTWLAAVIAARRILKAQTVVLVEQMLARRDAQTGRS